MILKAIAHIKATGQEVLGVLIFETITIDAGWKHDDKGELYWQTPKEKYLPIFKTYQRIEPFRGTSKVVVNNKFEFIAYSGVRCLIGTEAISKTSRRIGGLMMKKAMLSQPMAGKTDEEIVATREKAIKVLEGKGYEIVNTLFTDEWYSNESMKERGVVQIPLCFLAKSLENMSLCHAAYFCKGWENARGCRIEHDAAVAYGLEIIYED